LIAVIADTHMPKGSRELPDRCVRLLGEAEAVIHAGDFSAPSVLARLGALCPVVHAVHGNVDEEALRGVLPETIEVAVGGRTVAAVHDAGLPRAGRPGSALASPLPTRSYSATVTSPSTSGRTASRSSTQAARPSGAGRRDGRWACSATASADWFSSTFGFDRAAGARFRHSGGG
jgi:hypothetical protein